MRQSSARAMRIALLAPPVLPVPPVRYGGTERIVAELARGLHRAGHEVTLFGPGDSRIAGRVVPTVAHSIWRAGAQLEPEPHLQWTAELAERHADEFDLIHSHIEANAFEFARRSPTPFVSTIHGRVDCGPTAEGLALYPDANVVAISHSSAVNERPW